MSAMIQLVNQSPGQSPMLEGVEERAADFYSTETKLEQRLNGALAYISLLQTRICNLQEQLSHTERELVCKEALLRNMTVREQELRRQIAHGW
ncbi:MAG TPA: hypothetical protein VFD58_30150 [Blastocatellia bacterium]|nr:hypothetical protein [Blastocatellia bacterium]